MPLDFIGLQDDITAYVKDAQHYQELIEKQTQAAIDALRRFSSNPQVLRAHGEKAHKRVALPTEEDPAGSIACSAPAADHSIVSVDGSQIVPDRHTPPYVALVNTGIIRFPAGQSPLKPVTLSKFYKYEDLFDEANLISEDMVNLDRDVMEMKYLNEYSPKSEQPVIALRDGMLELYHEPRTEKWYRQKVEEYSGYLNDLKSKDVITAGYVDKPRSRSLITLIDSSLEQSGRAQDGITQFPHITDTHVFSLLLEPAQRSAIFETRVPGEPSSQEQEQKPVFYFFYLNVSQTAKPWVVRVEIPEWVACDKEHDNERDNEMVNILHLALLQQCAIMGSKPYPYCLHRAHETAVVHPHEKAVLEKMINAGLCQTDKGIEEVSHKQSLKDQT